MGLVEQAKLFPAEREVPVGDQELEQSLRELGPLRKAIVWEGNIIDGNRRLQLCNKLGIELPFIVVTDRIEAARRLYAVHPRRAFLMFAHEGISRRDLAYLFGVPVHKLPSAQQLRDARKRTRVKRTPETAVFGGIWMERIKLEELKNLCLAAGISLSALVRELLDAVLMLGERDLFKKILSRSKARDISLSALVFELLETGLQRS